MLKLKVKYGIYKYTIFYYFSKQWFPIIDFKSINKVLRYLFNRYKQIIYQI